MNAPVRKRFDRELFNETDGTARDSARIYWTSLGHTVEDHPDRYAVDLIVDTGSETLYWRTFIGWSSFSPLCYKWNTTSWKFRKPNSNIQRTSKWNLFNYRSINKLYLYRNN